MKIKLFEEPKIPEEYRDKFYAEFIKINNQGSRLIALLGGFLVPLFFLSGIDYLYDPDGLVFFLILRIIISILCFCIYFAAKQKKWEKYSELFSILCLLILGFGIDIMTRRLGYDSPYYAGLNLVYLASLVCSIGGKKTLLACMIIYSMYVLPILISDLNNIDWTIFVNNNQFQIFTIIIVTVVNHFQSKTRQNEILNRIIITKQTEELKKSEEVKKDFIASISHDIKTPISVISGHAELLSFHFEPGSKGFNNLYFINNSIGQMTRLLDRLISISLLDNAEEKPNLDLFDYGELIEKIAMHFDEPAAKKSINYHVTIPKEKAVVQIDEMWMERIIGNLVRNAFKFTNKGGDIWVTVTKGQNDVFTEVRDTGCGIENEKLPHIFEKKFQAEEGKKKEGYGLGLFIVKQFIERLGGSISVGSEIDKGTTFYFSIPLYVDQYALVKNMPYDGIDRRQNQRRRGVDRRLENRVEKMSQMLSHEIDEKKFDLDLSSYENKKPDKPTVLICDDTMGQMTLIVKALDDQYNLIMAGDGEEGLKKAHANKDKISVILSDMKMPKMDGLELREKLLEDHHLKELPFLFITAHYNVDEAVKGFKLGATDYLQKPVNASILKEKVNHWMTRKNMEMLLKNLSLSWEEKANEVSKLRDVIMHEIRNPLAVLTSSAFFIEKLRDHYLPDAADQQKRWWGNVDKFTSGIDALNSVLNLSKKMKNMHEYKKKVTIKEVMDQTVKQVSHLLGDVDFKMIMSDLDSKITIHVEKDTIVQVFINLIRNAAEAVRDNASKMTEKGLVHVLVKSEGSKRVHVAVTNNGPEIPKDVMPNLFRYNFTTKKYGTGIGLHFSKMIVKIHEGKIEVHSADNETVFNVSLPIHEKS